MQRWISRAVNYQINLRGIAAREPRNPFEAGLEQPPPSSPLAYLTKHLAALQSLGVTVLHLMPPFAIGREGRKGIGSPYAVRDFLAIDPEFGTETELAAFVRSAHTLGFKVIVGMMPNHTSRDHVWIRSHPEYYVKNDQGEIAYDLDWSDTAKLDYTQPGLRQAMLAVYDHWLGFLGKDADGQPDGVDGFRLDMAHFINDRTFWDDTLPVLKARHPKRELLFMAECYGMDNNKDLFRRGMTAAYDDDFYKILLYLYGRDEQGESIILPDHEDAPRNNDFRSKYEVFKEGGIAAAVEKCLMDYETDFDTSPDTPRLARYTDNHDEGRGVYRFGDGAVRAMMQLAFLSPHGIPFMLCGQEFGAANRPPIHERIQPCDKGYRMRQGDRIIKREGVEFEGNLFARGHEARQAWYAFYKHLIALRLNNPALTDGDFTLIDVGEVCDTKDRCVVAFARTHEGTTLHCAVNLGPEPRECTRAEAFAGDALYGRLAGKTLAGFAAIVTRGDRSDEPLQNA